MVRCCFARARLQMRMVLPTALEMPRCGRRWNLIRSAARCSVRSRHVREEARLRILGADLQLAETIAAERETHTQTLDR